MADTVGRPILLDCAKFHGGLSNNCWDIAICWFFKMAADEILRFAFVHATLKCETWGEWVTEQFLMAHHIGYLLPEPRKLDVQTSKKIQRHRYGINDDMTINEFGTCRLIYPKYCQAACSRTHVEYEP